MTIIIRRLRKQKLDIDTNDYDKARALLADEDTKS
jgi:hypothetical protein